MTNVSENLDQDYGPELPFPQNMYQGLMEKHSTFASTSHHTAIMLQPEGYSMPVFIAHSQIERDYVPMPLAKKAGAGAGQRAKGPGHDSRGQVWPALRPGATCVPPIPPPGRARRWGRITPATAPLGGQSTTVQSLTAVRSVWLPTIRPATSVRSL